MKYYSLAYNDVNQMQLATRDGNALEAGGQCTIRSQQIHLNPIETIFIFSPVVNIGTRPRGLFTKVQRQK